MTIELPHRFKARDYQRDMWRGMDTHKRCLMVFHRRAGKDKLCFTKLICRAIETKILLVNYKEKPRRKMGVFFFTM